MAHDPRCPICLAGAHAAGHPPPEEPEPEEPLAPMALVLISLVSLLALAVPCAIVWSLWKLS
ncbi:hypothetical protein [Streptomyces sp. NPDC001205]